MARKSNSLLRCGLRLLLLAALTAAAVSPAWGCPFCTALEPTLCQQRAGAVVTALAEVVTEAAGGPATLTVHQVLTGGGVVAEKSSLSIPLDLAVRPGQLVVLFGAGLPDRLSWHAVAVDEASYAYFARAPKDQLPPGERLAYFARFLEHPDALIAEDAYLEFGHAPFSEVASVSELVPAQRVREWLTSERVPAERKGFYGLWLGLARKPEAREVNAELLEKLILAPENDFRSGFDGILGGYLLLRGASGLDLLESRYLTRTDAAVGDVRHVQAALRFYHEYGREIPADRLCGAMRRLLARPEFAEAAIVDLARWQDWDALEAIIPLYDRPGYSEPGVRRAIIGYLLVSPGEEARVALGELRASDPDGVAEAELVLSRTGSVPLAQ